MSHGDPQKWHMPGWRIEQRYAPGVLIGNWAEEKNQVRYVFQARTALTKLSHKTDSDRFTVSFLPFYLHLSFLSFCLSNNYCNVAVHKPAH